MLPWASALLGCVGEDLAPDFAGTPLTRLARKGTQPNRACTSESRSVSARPHPDPPAHEALAEDKATLLGFSRRFVPERSNGRALRGYCFASRRVVHHCRPTGDLCKVPAILPEPLGSALGAEHKATFTSREKKYHAIHEMQRQIELTKL